jgi:hypothetical protein
MVPSKVFRKALTDWGCSLPVLPHRLAGCHRLQGRPLCLHHRLTCRPHQVTSMGCQVCSRGRRGVSCAQAMAAGSMFNTRLPICVLY